MYNDIYKIIENYCAGYNKRAEKNRVVNRHDAEIALAYTKLRATDQSNLNEALKNLSYSDVELYYKLYSAGSYGIEITVSNSLVDLTSKLLNINEALCEEERENFGLGSNAKDLRRRWRLVRKEIRDYINRSVKNKILYIKEWSKPRQVYVLNYTGEVHNGLYWTLRELITHPTYIKYGFKKEEQ